MVPLFLCVYLISLDGYVNPFNCFPLWSLIQLVNSLLPSVSSISQMRPA